MTGLQDHIDQSVAFFSYPTLTFPFTRAITSSAMLLGAGA
jgi:hypothetical protein